MTLAPCSLCSHEFEAKDLLAFDAAKLCAPCHKNLKNPVWRLHSLYSIMSSNASGEDAGVIPFRPTPEQSNIIDAVYVRREEFIVVVKSRQLGLSTVVCLIILDALLFGSGIQTSIVDATAPDAEKKLDQKIKLAFEKLPEWLRAGWEIVHQNTSEFVIKNRGKDKSDERSCTAGLRARGGTNHLLFISEWGTIQEDDKRRSMEILTGALPSADHLGCVTIVESTWRGGKTGELWPFVDQARKLREEEKGPKDPRLYFIGWYTNARNVDEGSPHLITEETHQYFDKLQTIAQRIFTNGQRLWWQKRKQKFGVKMGQEHPSTLEEALESPHAKAFFDPLGVSFQESCAIELEHQIQYGDITIQEPSKATFWRPMPKEQAVFRLWDRPQEGHSYLISVDSRVGRQAAGATGELDCNCAYVTRAGKTTAEGRVMLPKVVAALMMDDRCGTVELIRRVVALHLYYGACMVVPEVNNKDDIAERMMAAGVSRMWTQRIGVDGAIPGTTRENVVYGWCTSPGYGGTRKQMLDLMQELVLQQKFIGADRQLAHQLSVFIYRGKPGHVPVPSAAEGEHDDTVTCLAIGLFCLPAATPYDGGPGQQAVAKVGPGGGWREMFCPDS